MKTSEALKTLIKEKFSALSKEELISILKSAQRIKSNKLKK
jgi:hypothetical protein